jgi:hypothetical protein
MSLAVCRIGRSLLASISPMSAPMPCPESVVVRNSEHQQLLAVLERLKPND